MGTFPKNLLTLSSSFFCFKLPVFFFFCRTPCFFFSVVTFSCLLESVVVSVLWSLFFCRKFCFLPFSFFSFLNKLLLMLVFFVENGVTYVFTSKEVPDSIFRVFVDVVFFAKPSMFPFFFQSLIFFGVCFFVV